MDLCKTRTLDEIRIKDICEQAGEFDTRLTASEIVNRLLNFSRGLVYNYCIEHKKNHPAWLQYALDCQSEYLTLFLTPKYREYARIEA